MPTQKCFFSQIANHHRSNDIGNIVDNYNGDSKADLVKTAQEKIDAIVALENAEQEQFDSKEIEIDFENSDPKDVDLFDGAESNSDKSDETEKDSNTKENEE